MPKKNFKDHLELSNASGTGLVQASLFGANYVAGVNKVDSNSDFSTIMNHLGATSVRYPGGTVTEQYFDPGKRIWEMLFEEGKEQVTASDGRVVEGPGRLFEFAHQNELSVQYVLPTAGLVTTKNGKVIVDQSDVKKVQAHVLDLLEGKFGPVDISHFEIGNEYYFHADLTPKEYAAVAKELILAVDSAIKAYAKSDGVPSDWQAPQIAVQAGAGWRTGDNEKIIDGLGDKALSMVDSVIFHYYPKSMDVIGTKDRHLG